MLKHQRERERERERVSPLRAYRKEASVRTRLVSEISERRSEA